MAKSWILCSYFTQSLEVALRATLATSSNPTVNASSAIMSDKILQTVFFVFSFFPFATRAISIQDKVVCSSKI
jgi:hypothetical protein